jgi:type II secretory pathway pseudopilin PulG
VSRVAQRETLRERGYNLVILSVLVMVLVASLAMIVPVLEQQDRRSREEEAIFRGLQYAEAIRRFQERQGRLPNSLDELLTVEPRSIRQLWDDPLTDDGEWGLVRGAIDPSGRPGVPEDPDDGGGFGGDDDDEGDGDDGGSGSRFERAGSSNQRDDSEVLGPISGVFTRAEGAPIKSFFGAESYDEWIFVPQLLPVAVVSADGELVSRPTAAWVGRPFRGGLVAPGLHGLPSNEELGGGSAPRGLSGGDDDDRFGDDDDRFGDDDDRFGDDDEDDG